MEHLWFAIAETISGVVTVLPAAPVARSDGPGQPKVLNDGIIETLFLPALVLTDLHKAARLQTAGGVYASGC
jgi:hypothetical protein